MSSKKDLLERMQKSERVVRRRAAAPAPAAEAATKPEPAAPSGRKTVIRRRRADRGGSSRPAAEARPTTAVRRSTTDTARPGSSLRRSDRPAPPRFNEPKEPEVVAEAPAAPEAVVEAPKPEPVVEAPKAAEPVVEAPKAESVAAEAPKAEPVAAEAPKAEPVAEAPKAEPVAAEAPKADAPVAEAPVAAAPVEEKPAPTPAKPTGRGALNRLPGLGSAVVSPPPGYDPSNPDAFRRRQEAQRARAQALGQTRLGTVGGRTEEDRRTEAARGDAPPTTGRNERGTKTNEREGRPKNTRGRGRRGMQERHVMDRVPRVRKPKRRKGPKIASPKAKAQKRKVFVDSTISVKQFAHEMGVKANQVLKVLMQLGVMCSINDQIDYETAEMVAPEFEYEVVNVGFQEDKVLIQEKVVDDDPDAIARPPVVTIMGHVDHGKTTLLDSIRKADVASGEAGGITQHIGAYQVERGGNVISFIDTPGHAAFTEMRARGANATDIVILVVAADDGVMPQTVESINHTKAAGVPIIVAVNKCDKPGVNPSVIRTKMMDFELVAEDFGGDVIFVDVSALTGDGVDALLDAVLLVAELAEFKANPNRHAEGVVLEARVERGRGCVATVLVQKGTLKPKDPIVLGAVYGKVRAMQDHNGKRMKTAGPSAPVEIIGLNEVPAAGDTFVVVKNDKDARALAGHRAEEIKRQASSANKKLTLQDLFAKRAEGEQQKLNLILRADVQGSLEAIKSSVDNLAVDGADVNVLHSAVGAVSESDITLAATYNGIVIGFNVRPDAKARRAAESKQVEVRHYKVIYEMLEDLENALKGLLAPVYEENILGHAAIRATFPIPKVGTVAGCFIVDGKVMRGTQVRLTRQGVVIYDGKLNSLKRFKDDVKEVANGYECGLGLENFNDIKVGDELECYRVVQVART
jgi:translation initiation factor IF-2